MRMTYKMDAIQAENLSKSYVIDHQIRRGARSLRELLADPLGRAVRNVNLDGAARERGHETFWALKDVSFTVREGERVAVIGSNGAGKSTLLKILSRVTEPTRGKVTLQGKVSSLLEVGTGFHPELTGRENVYLNGAVLGMRKSEIAAKFDQIVAFSGVEKFIDTPVKRYSSGMYVRLAFSVSAWLDPDILIVDEVLSVGDQAFQRRCAERMKELTADGRTVLFVSHSMQAVRTMCERALLLEHGQVASFVSVDEAAAQYIRSISPDAESRWSKPQFTPGEPGIEAHSDHSDWIRCLHVNLKNLRGDVTGELSIDEGFFINVTYEVLKDLECTATPNIHFYDEFGTRFFIALPEAACPQAKGVYTARCDVPPYLFNNGRYTAMIAISSFSLAAPLHFAYENALRFEVIEQGLMDQRRHGWEGALPGLSRYRLDWEYGVGEGQAT